jgi:multidrug efflux pump subunit AcrA (membrane-fusion protein)
MSNLKEKETKPQNREWVKNAAIIFLAVMLVLTFFSKTIMNISLTEVTGQYMTSGTISSSVQGTGTVVANMAYNVQLSETRTIKDVYVSVGDTVEEGQPLFELEEAESQELIDAEKTLSDMQYAYNTKLIQNVDANYASENQNIQALRDNLSDAISQRSEASTYESTYNTAKAEAASAQNEVNALQQTIADLQGKITLATANDAQIETLQSQLSAAQTAQTSAESALSAAQAKTQSIQASMSMSLAEAEAAATSAQRTLEDMELELTYLKEDYNALAADPEADADAVTEAQRAVERQEQAVLYQRADLSQAQTTRSEIAAKNEELTAAQEAQAQAQADLDEKKATVTAAQKALDEATQASTADLSAQLTEAQAELTSAQARLNTAQSNLSEAASSYTTSTSAANANVKSLQQSLEAAVAALAEQQQLDGVTSQTADLELEHAKEELDDQEALVEKLREQGSNTAVTAQYGGTISAVNVIAGDIVTTGQTLASVNVEGKEYTLTISVTAEQSQQVSVGDVATVTSNTWGDITAVLSAIKNDPDNPGQNKLLEFAVSGDVVDGQTLSLSIGLKDQTYDLVVPKSALHEDSNGPFVLIATSKSTPFGSRYIAQRVAVVVTASDAYRAAIDTGSASHDYVITTSTAPISAGEQVRLAN